MYHPYTEKPAYTLNTLIALHEGATLRGKTFRILITDPDDDDLNLPWQVNVHKVGPSGIFATTGDGVVMSDIDPNRVLYAEVI